MSKNKILEIGVGEGYNLNLLSQNRRNQVVGIELSKKAILETKKRFPHLDVKYMNAEKLIFNDQEFDEVYAFEVLEHVNKLDTVIKEIKRVLRLRGKLILSVPYEKSEYLLLKIRPTYFKEIHHVRIFKKNELELLMKNNGFKLINKKGRGVMSHITHIYLFLTTKKSNSQASIGDWRATNISKFIYYSVAYFQSFILLTPGKYVPIWIVTLPIGYVINFFGDKVFPKSIYYEFIKIK